MSIYLRNVSTLELDNDKCTLCGRCIDVCPRNVFVINEKKLSIIDKDRCMECGACMMNCAYGAVKVEKGVGCAAAVINGFLNKTEPSCGCGCGENSGSSCC